MKNRERIVIIVSMGIVVCAGIVLTKRMRPTRDEQTVLAIKLASAAHVTISAGKSRPEFMWALQECLGDSALVTPVSIAEVMKRLQSELTPRELFIGSKSGDSALIKVAIVQGVSSDGRLFGQAANVEGRNSLQLEHIDVGEFEWFAVTTD